MGIYSRDYLRDSGGSTGRGFTGGGDGTGWKRIIVITVAVFVAQLLFTREQPVPVEFPSEFGVQPVMRISLVQDWLALDPQLVLKGQIWRVLTYAFCHDRENVWHIIFNMLWLWWLGRALEEMYGTREFVLFYIAGAAVSGVAFLLLSLWLHDPTPAVGASGAVLAVTMLYAVHFPRQRIFIFGLIPVEIRLLVGLYLVYDLFPVLKALGGDNINDGVAHGAHLGGFAFGYLYFKKQWRLETLWERIRLNRLRLKRPFAAQPKVRVYQPSVDETENFDARVDKILAKIHDHGEASLTDEEREILKNASRRYKKR
jgi:membrane associated rhomboid family serine protease